MHIADFVKLVILLIHDVSTNIKKIGVVIVIEGLTS